MRLLEQRDTRTRLSVREDPFLPNAGLDVARCWRAWHHSDIHLTMRTYTDPRILDMAGALDSLPAIPPVLEQHDEPREPEAVRATGTDSACGPACGKRYRAVHEVASLGMERANHKQTDRSQRIDVSDAPDRGKRRLASPDSDVRDTTPKGTRTPVAIGAPTFRHSTYERSG